MYYASSGPASRRNPAGLAVTIALHAGLVAAALIGFGVITPDPQLFRSMPVTQIPDTPPPPQRNADVPKTIFDKVVVSVPEPIIDPFDPPKVDTTATLTRDPADNDVITGLSGGTVEIVKPPAGITRSAMIDPRYRADFEAPYPPASQRMGETGTVVVRVVVGVDGRVVRASIAQSSGFPRLDDAALKRALARWRFVPAMRDGSPVEAEREVPVTFRLVQG